MGLNRNHAPEKILDMQRGAQEKQTRNKPLMVQDDVSNEEQALSIMGAQRRPHFILGTLMGACEGCCWVSRDDKED